MEVHEWKLRGLHWHCYAQITDGRSYGNDRARRDRTTDLPPLVVREWLAKPDRLIRQSPRTPEDAVAWLQREFGRHASQMTRSQDGHVEGIPDETRWGAALHNLECGNDVPLAFWVNGGTSIVSLAVVAVADCGVRH
ncbi:MAG: hypothetical protein JWO67_4043 [Streptosporangiaceae bacterium]|nr:hypothetical protein [Streptosporangiaceae bacterium]